MMAQLWIIVAMAVVGAAIVAWDIYAAFFGSPTAYPDIDIGRAVRGWGLPYFVGAVVGHYALESYFAPPLWGAMAVMCACGIITITGSTIPVIQTRWRIGLRSFGLLLLGVVSSYFLWPHHGG